MRFDETELAGVFLIELDRIEDARGFFARTYCEREFTAQGLDGRFVQCNLSHNTARGTLRGLHFQREPRPETKLVRCIRGAIYDVVLDLRKDSTTYLRWVAVELSARNSLALYIPAGLAHGFQTLEDDTDVWYQMGEFYTPELAAGVRWNDPAFGIRWPIENPILSGKDRSYPDYIP
jgi:dTDP-4-dehydrorhamnose 3,5-epimerase